MTKYCHISIMDVGSRDTANERKLREKINFCSAFMLCVSNSLKRFHKSPPQPVTLRQDPSCDTHCQRNTAHVVLPIASNEASKHIPCMHNLSQFRKGTFKISENVRTADRKVEYSLIEILVI
jgi:hypothetical protein